MTATAYVNGAFVPLEQANISVLDRGFLFAESAYEVTAVIDGRMVDLDSHVERLVRSADEIGLSLPVTPQAIGDIQQQLIDRNGLIEGLIYLQLTGGADASRDFLPGHAPSTLVLFVQPKALAEHPACATGIAVRTMPDLRWKRRDIKSTGLLAQVLAKREAAAAGCQEAWMIEDGLITEGASSTAFIVDATGCIITRPNSFVVLPGCTGAAILALAQEMDLKIERRAFSLDEVRLARETFITSASTFVLPVVQVDDFAIGDGMPGPIAKRLREVYLDFARGNRS